MKSATENFRKGAQMDRTLNINLLVSTSAVAYVTKTCSRSFRLLIRVIIYQIVHIDK